MSESDLERAERTAVAAATVCAFLLIAQQVAARATRDALFLSAFRVSSLPAMMMAAAVSAFMGAEVLSRALTRFAPRRVVSSGLLLSAISLAALGGLSLLAPPLAAALLYLQVSAFGGALVSGFWSLVNERFDPHTARRVVGRIGTGAAAGGVVGGLLAWAVGRVLPVPALLPVLALLHAGVAFLLRRISRGGSPSEPGSRSTLDRGALALFTRAPYLRHLALTVGLGAFVEAIVDFEFKAQAVILARGGALVSVFAAFHTGTSLLSLVLQSTLARPSLEAIGLSGTLGLRPVLTALGAATGVAAPRFLTATLARGAHESLTNSLFRSAYELLYTPLPGAEKRRVKAVIDVSVDKAGTLLGAAVTWAAVALLPAPTDRPLFLLGTLCSVAALFLTRRLHRGYVRALERSLVSGRVRLDPADVLDPSTRLTLAQSGLIDRETLLREIEASRPGGHRILSLGDLRGGPDAVPGRSPGRETHPRRTAAEETAETLAALGSGDAARVQRVLHGLQEPGPAIVAFLLPLLAVDEHVPDLVRVLRRVAPRVTGQLVDGLLDPALPLRARRRIPRVLKVCSTRRAVAGLRAALDDEAFAIRSAAAVALASLDPALHGLSREEVLALAQREIAREGDSESTLPHAFTILSLALEREPLRIAWAALRGGDRTLRGTALEYLQNVLPEQLFASLRARLGAGVAAPPPEARRSVEQVTQDLRLSSAGLKLGQAPWQRPRED